MIPYGRQSITQSDIDAVAAVLQSDFLTQGPVVAEFEQALANHCGAGQVVVTSSATSALHLACMALGVGEGDWVWTSAMSFVASANCARYCGARVGFVDIDPASGNMSVPLLAEKLQQAAGEGLLPKVVIPVHFAGQSCEMAAIQQLAVEYGFRIIEDASHALGGRYDEQPVGNCRYSDIAVFSFHPVKMITTGEGGCLCTNDSVLAAKARCLLTHGITKDPQSFLGERREPWYYEQQALGYNYRMTDLQAALGLSQLQRLAGWVTQRNALMAGYYERTTELPVNWLTIADGTLCSFHLAVIKVAPEHRQGLFEFMRAHQVGVQVHYIPIYQQPFYAADHAALPNTDAFYQQVLSLPLYPTLTAQQQDYVVSLLQAFLQ